MTRRKNNSGDSQDMTRKPTTERAFVETEHGNVRIVSDERGDEITIVGTKISTVNAITVEGIADKEPVLVVHFDGGGAIQVPFNSRTNVQKAKQQFLNVLHQHK